MRSLKGSDLPALTRILKATEAFTADEIDCAMELLGIVLDDPDQKDYFVTVAETDGRVTGYILFGPVPLTEGNFDIYWIATDPEVQGHGFGRRLLEHAENVVCERGARLICLETSSQGGYERTRRFYEQAGYVEESRIRDFYRPGDDRITYVKRFSKKEKN
jgi:ribosomal protein S18 acetylase RimI-like enzyme